MFKKDYVLVGIKDHEGHLVPSSYNDEIKLKFNESYSIFIKNENYHDIAAEIIIDGTKVLGENKVKVCGKSSVDIDRFCIDGNGEEGRKFKFVPISNSGVQDPDSESNGNIEINIYKSETNNTLFPSSFYNRGNDFLRAMGPVGIGDTPKSVLGVVGNNSSRSIVINSNTSNSVSPQFMQRFDSLDMDDHTDGMDDLGATVEGDLSDQKIEKVNKIKIEEKPSLIFSFKLKGEKKREENKKEEIQSRVIIVLDKSGSMSSCRKEAIKAFNDQIDILKNSPDNVKPKISLLTFNSEVGEPIYKNIDVKQASCLKEKDYIPSGGTAMLDGVGEAVSFLNSLEEADDDNTAFLVIIISDGEENSSKLFGYEEISNLINGRQKTGKWTFSYLGANGLDLSEVNEKMSISKGNIQMFKSDSKGMDEANHKTVVATSGYTQSLSRGEMSSSCYYSEGEKED